MQYVRKGGMKSEVGTRQAARPAAFRYTLDVDHEWILFTAMVSRVAWRTLQDTDRDETQIEEGVRAAAKKILCSHLVAKSHDTCTIDFLSLPFLWSELFFLRIDYGLAAAVFTQNINRAIETAHKLQAGTAWVSFEQTYDILNFFDIFSQDQLYQPSTRTSSFRWIQTIWYWTRNGRIYSWKVR